LGTINPDTNKIPKHLFQGYLNIYNNYFKAPWMPDRTEANPNELNQDDARYGFRCCHLKNIWTAPLPPETELSRQMKIGRAVQQECRDRYLHSFPTRRSSDLIPIKSLSICFRVI